MNSITRKYVDRILPVITDMVNGPAGRSTTIDIARGSMLIERKADVLWIETFDWVGATGSVLSWIEVRDGFDIESLGAMVWDVLVNA